MSAPADTRPTGKSASRPAGPDLLLVALLTVLTGLTAVEVIFFLPLYAGSVPLPISVAAAAVVLFLVPRLAFRLVGRLWAAALPAVVWLVVTVALALQRNTLYPVPFSVGDWRITLLFGAGTVAAALAVGWCWGDTLPRAARDRRLPR